MNRSSAEIEQEVEASRAQLDRNVEALKDKMTPGQLLDESMKTMGGAGQQIASKFLEQAKQNPMPLAVMGLGLAWLMTSNSKAAGSAAAEPRSSSEGQHPADALGDPVGGLTTKAQAMTDKASGVLSSARDRLASGSASAKQTASRATDKAGDLAQRAQQGVQQVFENEPLLLGAVGFAVGLAVGAALPPTEAEDRLMGQARDRIMDKGMTVARTGLDQAASAAQEGYQGAKSELQSSEGAEMADRLAAAVKTGVSRAQDELKPH